MSIKCYINKYNVTYSYNLIWYSNENGQFTTAHSVTDDFNKQNIMWKEPDTKKYMQFITSLWSWSNSCLGWGTGWLVIGRWQEGGFWSTGDILFPDLGAALNGCGHFVKTATTTNHKSIHLLYRFLLIPSPKLSDLKQYVFSISHKSVSWDILLFLIGLKHVYSLKARYATLLTLVGLSFKLGGQLALGLSKMASTRTTDLSKSPLLYQ